MKPEVMKPERQMRIAQMHPGVLCSNQTSVMKAEAFLTEASRYLELSLVCRGCRDICWKNSAQFTLMLSLWKLLFVMVSVYVPVIVLYLMPNTVPLTTAFLSLCEV